MTQKTIGRFEVISMLGRGAMGCVLLAHDPRIDRRVAIKTLEGLGALPEADRVTTRVRFLREAQAAGRLSHPNIVTIFDVGEEGGTPYIAMEYLDGVSLASRTTAPGLLDLPEVVSIMEQACDALHYAHAAGIVHRDIKPANMMLLAGGALKIADFGLAKRPETNLTTEGSLVGTPYYMSPEQIRGQAIDGRSDLFSLGVVFYQLLNGTLPFPGESIHTVIHRILSDPPAEMGDGSRAPEPFRELLGSALAKDPALRPQTGESFRNAVRAAARAGRLEGREGSSGRGISHPGSHSLPNRMGTASPRGEAPQVCTTWSERDQGALAHEDRAGHREAARGAASSSVETLLTGVGRSARSPRSSSPRGRALAPQTISPRPPDETGTGLSGSSVRRRRSRRVLGAATVAATVLVAAAGLYYVFVLSRPQEKAIRAAVPAAARPHELADGTPPIKVVTEPGASLFLDGKPLTSPLVRLVEGDTTSHTLRAESGCRASETTVSAGVAGRVVQLELAPEKVRIQVASTPAGAKVSLNGTPAAGTTPLTIEIDRCVPNRIEIGLAKHEPVEYRLAASEPVAPLAAALGAIALDEEEPGSIRVAKGQYQGDVFIDGRRMGEAGGSFTVAAGLRRIELVSESLFVHLTEQVRAVPGGEIVWKPAWPALGALTVQATPTNCRIDVRAHNESSFRYLDDVPIVGHRLAAGTYIVRATLLNTNQVQEREVEVLAGTTVRVDFLFL